MGKSAPKFRILSDRPQANGTSKFKSASTSVRASTSAGVPPRTTVPRSSTHTRSASAASSMKWVIMTTVMPRPLSSLHTRISPLRPRGSSMADASSSTSTFGCMANTPAMATRCFCPPDSANVSCFSNPTSPTSRKASRTRRASSAVSTPRFSGPKATSSSTSEATSWSSGFWNTMPTVERMR